MAHSAVQESLSQTVPPTIPVPTMADHLTERRGPVPVNATLSTPGAENAPSSVENNNPRQQWSLATYSKQKRAHRDENEADTPDGSSHGSESPTDGEFLCA